MSDEFIPTLTHATERDIDLLLVEELFASPHFVGWLLGKSGLPNEVTSSTVLHSKRRTRSRREIDIFVEASDRVAGGVALLVENKLDATEQPDQAESYREELTVLADKFAQRVITIVCPSAYAEAHRDFTSKFDAVVTYEELADYFVARQSVQSADTGRMQFRADLLKQAVAKSRRGYTPVPNAVIGGFNARYVARLAQLAPEIVPGPTMLKEANPDESVSMIFDHKLSLAFLPDDLRPSRFAHELGRGSASRANYVSVVFPGWGTVLEDVRDQFEQDAADLRAKFSSKPPTKVRPNPGLVMFCETHPVDNQGDFESQRPAIEAGILRAVELRDWLNGHGDLVSQWHQRVLALKAKSGW